MKYTEKDLAIYIWLLSGASGAIIGMNAIPVITGNVDLFQLFSLIVGSVIWIYLTNYVQMMPDENHRELSSFCTKN